MDFNGPKGYKPATLFSRMKVDVERHSVRVKMDKDFLHQIDNVDELIPRSPEKLDDETLICECFCVSALDIRATGTNFVDLDLLEKRFNLGGACNSCLKNKDTWIDKIF